MNIDNTIIKYVDDDRDLIYENSSGGWHNPHGPAVKYENGDTEYYLLDKAHNIVGPSEIHHKGNHKSYYINGHRILEHY